MSNTQVPVPTIGRIVLATFKNDHDELVTRPASVVRVWSDDLLNIMVFTDGSNDFKDGRHTHWLTSVHLEQTGEVSHTWRWMPYQIANPGRGESKSA